MTSTVDALTDGDVVTVEARRFMWGNTAVQPYTTFTVDMFVHTRDDETVLYLEQDWLDDHPARADYARQYLDGIPLDPEHDRIESITANGGDGR